VVSRLNIKPATDLVPWPFFGTRCDRCPLMTTASARIEIKLDFLPVSVFLQMRSTVFLFLFVMPLLLLAEDTPLDSLPQAVRETIDMEKGDGVVKSAESYVWGEATIFKVEIDVNGVPTVELQIAGNGKLIRVDDLRVEKDDENEDNTPD